MLVKRKLLGETGSEIPEIGLGTWRYKGGTEPLRTGVQLGASLIDTAEMYRTESMVGEAIKEIEDQVFVATKVWGSNLKYDDVLRSAEKSIQLLGVNTIDLYQIHWPNSRVPIKETMMAMEQLVDRGLIKYIGVSNFSVGELDEAMSAMENYPIVSNQVIYNLKNREIERDILPFCLENNISVLAYTPLADGILVDGSSSRITNKVARIFNKSNQDSNISVLEAIKEQSEKSFAQIALNWCISHSRVIAIPKSNSIERTVENCGASGWSLTPDQINELERIFPIREG